MTVAAFASMATIAGTVVQYCSKTATHAGADTAGPMIYTDRVMPKRMLCKMRCAANWHPTQWQCALFTA